MKMEGSGKQVSKAVLYNILHDDTFKGNPMRDFTFMVFSIETMKNSTRVQILQRSYFHRLMLDRSVEDKMPVFAEAKRIFELLKRKSGKKDKR